METKNETWKDIWEATRRCLYTPTRNYTNSLGRWVQVNFNVTTHDRSSLMKTVPP